MAESSDGKQSSCFHRTSPRARHMPSNDTRPRCRAASEVQALGAGSQPRTPNTLRHPFSYATREIREAPLARDGAELRVYGGLFRWAAPSTESKSGRCEIQLRTLRVKYRQYPMADRNGTRTASLRSKRRDSMMALPATLISSCCGGAMPALLASRSAISSRLNTVVAGFLWKLGDRETAVLVAVAALDSLQRRAGREGALGDDGHRQPPTPPGVMDVRAELAQGPPNGGRGIVGGRHLRPSCYISREYVARRLQISLSQQGSVPPCGDG